MREILFRAKTEPNTKSSMTGKIIKNPKWIYGYIDLGYMHDCKTALIGDEKGNNVYKCQYETIGQYTGLTDKNGTKIFEGDIVKCSDVDDCYYTEEKTEFFGVIKFEAGVFGIATKEKLQIALDNWCENDNFVSLWELEWNEYIGNVEVIGNIHDNPELLGGGEK